MNLSNSEELQKEFARIKEEVRAQKEKSWENEKTNLESELDAVGFPKDEHLRELYFKSAQIIWTQGYAMGVHDTTIGMAQELGLGDVMETMGKFQIISTPATQNN